MWSSLADLALLIWCSQIHNVNSEQWLGTLLHANDELVTALMTFEQLDRSIDADSDSDDEMAQQAHIYRCNLTILTIHFTNTDVYSGNRKEQGKRHGSTACGIEARNFKPGAGGSSCPTTKTFPTVTSSGI